MVGWQTISVDLIHGGHNIFNDGRCHDRTMFVSVLIQKLLHQLLFEGALRPPADGCAHLILAHANQAPFGRSGLFCRLVWVADEQLQATVGLVTGLVDC